MATACSSRLADFLEANAQYRSAGYKNPSAVIWSTLAGDEAFYQASPDCRPTPGQAAKRQFAAANTQYALISPDTGFVDLSNDGYIAFFRQNPQYLSDPSFQDPVVRGAIVQMYSKAGLPSPWTVPAPSPTPTTTPRPAPVPTPASPSTAPAAPVTRVVRSPSSPVQPSPPSASSPSVPTPQRPGGTPSAAVTPGWDFVIGVSLLFGVAYFAGKGNESIAASVLKKPHALVPKESERTEATEEESIPPA